MGQRGILENSRSNVTKEPNVEETFDGTQILNLILLGENYCSEKFTIVCYE